MRTIKFCGKTEHGKWVYGDLCQQKNSTLITNKFEIREVLPDTVGQFTGLLDKNGKEIYEGDILNVDTGINIHKTHVKFDQERGCWHRVQDYSISEVVGKIHDNPELLTDK